MKKRDLKDYNRLLRDRNEVLEDLMQLVNDSLSAASRCELLQEENDELVSARDWNNAQDELISKIADTAMDYLDDIDDLQADWATDHADYRERVIKLVTQRTRESDLAVRLQSRIAELQNENKELTTKNKKLKENMSKWGNGM